MHNLYRVMYYDTQILNLSGMCVEETMTGTGLMHFDANEVHMRIIESGSDQRFAIAETYFQNPLGLASKKFVEV